MGEKSANGLTSDGTRLAITFQVAAVDRPLIAVSKLTAAGYKVQFGKDDGTITNNLTGRVTPFVKIHGVYVLKVWTPRTAATERSCSGGSRP